tara:strand:- start:4044 stop:4949 length:906 start_codon:yes stop_codon:yes gene_type:complete
MENKINIGFSKDALNLAIDSLVYTKPPTQAALKSKKYNQIIASISVVGVIEPPVVFQDETITDKYILLDGHLRIEALKSLGNLNVLCLVSKDNEAFTYNKHINRLSTIQEHKMILRAIERGVSEDKIASALSVDIRSIRSKKKLLDGICEDASEILKDKIVSMEVFQILKKMKSVRQIEAAILMNDANIFTVPYAKALLASTGSEFLANPGKPKNIKGITEEQMKRMELEMQSLDRDFKVIEENYGQDILNLTLAKGYLAKLIENQNIRKYLATHHAGLLDQFGRIAEIETLNYELENIVI